MARSTGRAQSTTALRDGDVVIPSSQTAVTIGRVRATVVPAAVPYRLRLRSTSIALWRSGRRFGVSHMPAGTISGVKHFATGPGFPLLNSDDALKSILDQSVATVGADRSWPSGLHYAGPLAAGRIRLPRHRPRENSMVDTQLACEGGQGWRCLSITEL